ncbi:chemotaxis response regulator protein-glutamate methylesterase [Angustibacter peucedani]
MPPVRVLVVDDSVVVRRLVSDVLGSDPDIEVVGTAPNGRLALTKLAQVSPDLVTLDVEMPEMDGLTALREMRAQGHRLPVIMFSTLTERGATATLDALEAGASDYVTKPANVGSLAESLEQVRRELVPKIKALVPRRPLRPAAVPPATTARPALVPAARTAPAPAAAAPAPTLAARRNRETPYRVLAVGCSTGGPEALSTFLAALPADLPVPVVVVQHMPPVFTRQFAARLDRNLPFTVVESAGGERLQPGHVYVAPGDFHLRLRRRETSVITVLDQQPPENFCRPAVDVLFRSTAEVFGPDVLAVVLTGMGSDGKRGSQDVVAAGGSVLVQDAETSVVWGMPGAVAQAGAAEEVLPLPLLAAAVARRVTAGSQAGSPVGGAR